MKNKFQFILIFLTFIVFLFPSIGFPELKDVMNEYCDIYKGDIKNKKSLDEFKKTVSAKAKEGALKKIAKEFNTSNIHSDCIRYATNNLLDKVDVLRHTEKAEENGRNICEKVKVTYKTEVISKYLSQESCLKDWGNGKENYDWCSDVDRVMPENKGKLNVALIIETKIPDMDEQKRVALESEEEKQFLEMTDASTDKYNVVDKSSFVKIAEKNKIPLSGITDNDILRLGKLLNLDVIVHRLIYKDSKVTKVRKINTGKVLLYNAYETAKESSHEPEATDWVKYGKDSRGTLHYYKKGSVDEDKNIVKVLNKWVFSRREKSDAIQFRRENRLSTKGYENLSHMVYLSEIDCQNQSERMLYLYLYDKNDKSLYSHTFKNTDWTAIQPESNGDALLKAVCK